MRESLSSNARCTCKGQKSSKSVEFNISIVPGLCLCLIVVGTRCTTYTYVQSEPEREHAGIVRSLVQREPHTPTGPSLFAIYASEIPKIGALLPVRSLALTRKSIRTWTRTRSVKLAFTLSKISIHFASILQFG